MIEFSKADDISWLHRMGLVLRRQSHGGNDIAPMMTLVFQRLGFQQKPEVHAGSTSGTDPTKRTVTIKLPHIYDGGADVDVSIVVCVKVDPQNPQHIARVTCDDEFVNVEAGNADTYERIVDLVFRALKKKL